ncbi:class I SAM-dependent methyltransferase [bacterium]|nr:class I SAM-dependent methyltransferase [bacterium]
MGKKKVLEKYRLYEAAVQDAHQQVAVTEQVFEENFAREPLLLKEDFSGTSWISTEWVKRGKQRMSLALDIDEEALEAGRALHVRKLSPEAQSRLHLLNQNVMKPTAKKVDAIAACNFSYFIFQHRSELLRYFEAAHASLRTEGVFLLETAGGPGFVESPFREQRTVKHESGKKKGKKWFRYTWHQRSFDPQYRRGLYSIHFDLLNGEKMKDAFVYDWRIWTIPEVRDALIETGFDEVQVYWEEDDPDDEGYPVYSRRETGDSTFDTYIVYIVGVKRGGRPH